MSHLTQCIKSYFVGIDHPHFFTLLYPPPWKKTGSSWRKRMCLIHLWNTSKQKSINVSQMDKNFAKSCKFNIKVLKGMRIQRLYSFGLGRKFLNLPLNLFMQTSEFVFWTFTTYLNNFISYSQHFLSAPWKLAVCYNLAHLSLTTSPWNGQLYLLKMRKLRYEVTCPRSHI